MPLSLEASLNDWRYLMIDRMILGDNQFFGINHMSEEKAEALAVKFGDIQSIIDVIDIAYECGIRGFMFNTHARTKDICDHFRNNPFRYADLVLYPSMPYAHKYANAVAEKGIFSALKETIISDNTTADIMGILAKSGMSIFEKDMIKVMELLVDIEMKMFRGLNVRVVFLQNVVTDLLLGLGAKDFFIGFSAYVKEKYKAEAGFNSMNMPMLVDFLLECGLENPIVCSSINKVGYFMSPDINSYEETIKTKAFRPLAMSVLASGAIPADEAIEYICKLPQIRSIVFGASSRKNIEETKKLIDKYSNQ
jgi:hypothetical protein